MYFPLESHWGKRHDSWTPMFAYLGRLTCLLKVLKDAASDRLCHLALITWVCQLGSIFSTCDKTNFYQNRRHSSPPKDVKSRRSDTSVLDIHTLQNAVVDHLGKTPRAWA